MYSVRRSFGYLMYDIYVYLVIYSSVNTESCAIIQLICRWSDPNCTIASLHCFAPSLLSLPRPNLDEKTSAFLLSHPHPKTSTLHPLTHPLLHSRRPAPRSPRQDSFHGHLLPEPASRASNSAISFCGNLDVPSISRGQLMLPDTSLGCLLPSGRVGH